MYSDQNLNKFKRTQPRVFKVNVKLRLYTAVNRVDFVSRCMLYTYEGNKISIIVRK